ncbi:MAG TPA: hypothetical protein VD978_30030 [Azospirillum sp.]|nr:hypothetical protein [Azospirillum sp.]
MAQEQADLLGGNAALAHLAGHAVPDRVWGDALVQPCRLARDPPHMEDGANRLVPVTDVPAALSHRLAQPWPQRRRDRHHRPELLVLNAAGRIEVEKPMLRVVLRRFEVQNGSRAGQRVGGDQQEQQHVARLRRIEEARQLRRRDRAALRLARPLGFRGDGPEYVGGLAQLLPLLGAVQRRPSDRQDAVDAARAGSSAGEPFAEPALLVGRDVGDGSSRPELLPIGEAKPLGPRTR